MNLTRIKQMPRDWTVTLMDIYDTYRENITYADQDILNIFLHDVRSKRPEVGCKKPYEISYIFSQPIM